MARRKNHHPRNNECASSVRSASLASSSNRLSGNLNSPSNNSNNTANNRTCAVSNENKTIIRRSNGIRVQSEAEEEEGDEGEEENSGEDEVAEDEGDGDEDDGDGDDEAGRRDDDDVKSNNSNNSNQNLRRKSVKRKRRKRLGRPPQNLSMDETNSANGSVGSATRHLTNGCQQSFQCPSCKKEVDSASEFTRHIRQHNTVESAASSTHSCSLCGKVLSSASSLDRHMLVHSGERPFKCSRCDMAFTTNGNMHRHMRTHHDGGYKSSSPSLNNSLHNNSNISDDEYNNNTTKKSRGTAVKRKLHMPKSSSNGVTGGRNLWPKRSRCSADDDDEEMDEEGEEKDDEEDMNIENGMDDGATFQCLLCCRSFLRKAVLTRHLDEHPVEDFKCEDCEELFDDWRSLFKHLDTVHLKSLEEPTLILGPDGETTIVNINNNNNVKDADTGFHDLTFVDFSTAKFALIAKSVCEKHVRRPSSAYYSFQCHHCWKAFPCENSLKMHMKTTHVLSTSTRKSTPPPNATTTCVKCQADFPTHHHLETHSLRHQATEQCATPYSKLSVEESRQMQKMRPHVVTGDAAPEIDVDLDKKSFLALLELQSRNEAEVAPEEDELSQNKKNNKLNGRCSVNNKTPHVIDTHSNDFADIQSILDVTSSTTINIIPSILKMGSSPATNRPSSTPSADLPASPRLADSVTASPELPSPNQNQTPVSNDGPAENENIAAKTTTFEPEPETEANKESHTDEEEDELETEDEDEEDSSDDVPLIVVKKSTHTPVEEESPSLVMDLSSTTAFRIQPSPIIPSLTQSMTSFTPAQPLSRNIIFGTSGLYPKQKPQEESNSLKSLIDLTNSAAAAVTFQPPQEQPLDLAIQPIDLTKRFANDSSASAVILSLTPTSGSTSTLPMDLSASTRQRLTSHRMSPLMTSTPSGGGARRIGPIISTLSSQAAAAAAAVAAAASQAQQQVIVENISPGFSNRFNSALLVSSEKFSTSASNSSLHQARFQSETVRRPVQQGAHQLISNVGDSVVPLAMSQQASSHMNHMENPLRSISHSVHSSVSSAFLLKKQKQRRYRTERPFKCDYCAAGFTLRSNMERHIKQQHPEFWASKSRGRKDRALASHSLSSRPASVSPSLPIQMPSQRIMHSVTVPNVAFPSIPPPQNVSEYNPVLAAANLSISRPPVILNRSPSPPTLPPIATRMSSVPNSNLNKSAVTISDEVKLAISNQIKQRQSVDLINTGTILSLTSATPINMVSIVTPIASHSDTGSDSVLNSPVESNHSGKASSIRNIWRPAPQMESETKSAVEDADECGADLASVSKLLSTANQQNIQELFRKRRSGDEDEEEENEYENSGNKTEESEEDQPLANLKPKEGGEMLPKTPERSKDGRKSAYVNAPNRVACPYCNRQFPWTSSLRRHVLTHTGQKPFKCPKCPLWFTTKSNCDRHLSRKHAGSGGGSLTLGIASSGSVNVICEPLENTDGQLIVNSTQNSSLPNNLNSQNVDCTARNAPDRPYRCNMCLSSTFSTPGNLQKHMMTKHPQAPNTVSAAAARTKQSQKEFSYANNTPARSDSTTSGRIETNGGGGESNSGSEKFWGAESEESSEEQVMSENGQSDGAPLFFCFVCLKSFEDRGHCLEHLKDYHPDEHGFLIKTDNEQLISGMQREKSSSDAEEP